MPKNFNFKKNNNPNQTNLKLVLTKRCLYCGDEFNTTEADNNYCSSICRDDYTMMER